MFTFEGAHGCGSGEQCTSAETTTIDYNTFASSYPRTSSVLLPPSPVECASSMNLGPPESAESIP